MDSAAPGSERKVVCERCFARVSEREQVCPECGAPLRPDVIVPAADSAVHAELAQANLLRLRGDVDAAERKCLSILKRYPNEPEAHVLLGELSADRGDWRRAVEWYELAVDLNPSSTADRAKLDEAKKRVEDADTAETVEQLGLPETTSRTPWLVGAVVIILSMVIVAAMVTNKTPPKQDPKPIDKTIIAPPDQKDSGGDTNTAETGTVDQTSGTSGATNATNSNPASIPVEDGTLLSMLVKRSTEGGQIQSVILDPRDHAIFLTYNVPAGGDARKLGAILAKDALTQSPDSLVVTVRGVSGDQLVFVADATRPKLSEIDSEGFKSDNSANPDAWIAVLLQREWTAQTGANPSPPATTGESGSTGSTTGSDTGATAPGTGSSAKPGG